MKTRSQKKCEVTPSDLDWFLSVKRKNNVKLSRLQEKRLEFVFRCGNDVEYKRNVNSFCKDHQMLIGNAQAWASRLAEKGREAFVFPKRTELKRRSTFSFPPDVEAALKDKIDRNEWGSAKDIQKWLMDVYRISVERSILYNYKYKYRKGKGETGKAKPGILQVVVDSIHPSTRKTAFPDWLRPKNGRKPRIVATMQL